MTQYRWEAEVNAQRFSACLHNAQINLKREYAAFFPNLEGTFSFSTIIWYFNFITVD